MRTVWIPVAVLAGAIASSGCCTAAELDHRHSQCNAIPVAVTAFLDRLDPPEQPLGPLCHPAVDTDGSDASRPPDPSPIATCPPVATVAPSPAP